MFPELHWRGRRVLVSVPGVNYCWFTGVAKPWQNVLHQRPGMQQGHSTRSGTGGTSIVSPSDSSRVLDRKFPCPNCTSVFSRKGGLTYHQKFECGQNPRFNCPYCSYCARHISNARRHVRKCHPGRDVYTVDLCQLQQNVAWNYTRRRFESSQPEEGGFDRKPWNIYLRGVDACPFSFLHSPLIYTPTFVHRRLSSLFGGMAVPIEIRVRQQKFRYFFSFFFTSSRFLRI